MDFKNKKILVVGLGLSGQAAVRFFLQQGAFVVTTDQGAGLLPTTISKHPRLVETHWGKHSPEFFLDKDLILVSPGVSLDLPGIRVARRHKIPILGEFGLAAQLLKSLKIPMIAVTGTNGKSTTVTLIAEILKKSGFKTVLAGNIGKPLLEVVMENSPQSLDWVVAEVSSYQLDTVEHFRPHISVLLNVTEDHLDRYSSFRAYAQSKARIFQEQKRRDVLIYNQDDKVVRRLVRKAHCQKIPLNFFQPIKRINTHNVQNVSASIAVAHTVGVKPKIIQEVLENFRGLPHRVEFVRKHKNVSYYDDSKATNVDAVVRALERFDNSRVILLGGGREKEGSYIPLARMAKKKVKLALLFGEAKKNMAQALSNVTEVLEMKNLKEAVVRAHQQACPGDVVLLSPACSSFDQFKDYKERGNLFQKLVKNL